MAKNQIKKISNKHDLLIDYLIDHPEMPLGEVATQFNYTQTHLSVIVNSDSFQILLDARKQARRDITSEKIQEQLMEATSTVLSTLVDRAQHERKLEPLTNAADTLLKATGFIKTGKAGGGGGPGSGPVLNVTMINEAKERVEKNVEAIAHDPDDNTEGGISSNTLPQSLGSAGSRQTE